MPEQSVLYAASGGTAAILFAYAIILPEMELSPLFVFPWRIKTKHLASVVAITAAVLLLLDRQAVVWHSAIAGGAFTGCLYAHLLGFGRPSFLQRYLHHRRTEAERYKHMTAEELITAEVDPLLEKISQRGLDRLTKREQRILLMAREKLLDQGRSG
jgi:hypothetical protein